MRSLKFKIHNSKLTIAAFALATALLATVSLADAQQAKKAPRIGFLAEGPASAFSSRVKAFAEGLRALGWVDGQNISVEYRWWGNGAGSSDALAAELVRLQVDVIFATNTPAVLATKKAGAKVPVVFAAVSEPIEIGAVASLARPGSNFTGLTTINRELMPKRLELLKEAIPGLTRVGHLANPAYALHQPQLKEMEAAARSLRMELQVFEVRDVSELERAFVDMARARVGAFIVQQGPPFLSIRRRMIDLAARGRIPGMYHNAVFIRDGGIISYGADLDDLFRRAATYVDKILKGAKPGDLPVERPTKFELFINLKAAKQIGLTIPQSVLYRADKVIK